jgi:hypothetical protein
MDLTNAQLNMLRQKEINAWDEGWQIGHAKGMWDQRELDSQIKVTEEIDSLDMDLLTILSRIYQGKELITMIDPTTVGRIVSCDAPRLARRLKTVSIEWIERTDLDTGFVDWLAGLRYEVR